MKIYVDELPKSCADCYCCNNDYEKGYCCNLGCFNEETCDYSLVSKQRCTECQLQLLSDHDKQVRKEVCDEIRKLAKSQYSEYTLGAILDQIQGETK